MLQASCLQQLYCCTENRLAEKSAILKQPERGCSQSKPIIKSADLKDNVSQVTRHKQNHMTTSHDQVKTQVPKIHLMILETFKISQSPDNYASSNQLEHLKKMGISKSHDDLRV